MKPMSEDRIQTIFMNWCRKMAKFSDERFELVHHVPNGGTRNKREAHKFKLMGVVPGIPDVFIPIPFGGEHGLWLEFKSAKGRLSKPQKRIIPLLQAQDFCVVVVRSPIEAKKAVEDYLCQPLPDFGLREGANRNP